MLIEAVISPRILTSRGDECWRYDVTVTNWLWADLVDLLVRRDIGVPIAYRSSRDKEVIINPRPDVFVDADKLYVLVRTGNARPDKEIIALLRLNHT